MTGSGRRVQFLDGGSLRLSRTLALDRGSCVHSVEGDPVYKWILWHVAFSATAAYVMTCESRRSPALEHFHKQRVQSSVLKWWCQEEGEREYVLHSMSHNAHAREITALVAHPQRESRFFTASRDGTFKCWDLVCSSEDSSHSKCWQCVMVGAWHSWPIASACLSVDGSTLALGLQGFVSLWGAEACTELRKLPLGEASCEAEQLQSVMACDRFLLLGSVRGPQVEQIMCWDLVELTLLVQLDAAAALEGSGQSLLRVAPPAHSSSGVHVVLCRREERRLQLWWLAPGAGGSSRECRLDQVASLLLGQVIVDAVFLGSPRRLLCWTARHELWDLNLLEDTSSVRPTGPATDVQELVPNTSTLAQVIGSSIDVAGGRIPKGIAFWQLVVPPLRAIAAQNVGIVPQLIESIVPSHVPSHMLHPPSMIWSGMVSVFGKSLPGFQQRAALALVPVDGLNGKVALRSSAVVAAFSASTDGEEAVAGEETGALAGSGGRQSAVEFDKLESVDIAWMDQLVQEALLKASPHAASDE